MAFEVLLSGRGGRCAPDRNGYDCTVFLVVDVIALTMFVARCFVSANLSVVFLRWANVFRSRRCCALRVFA